MKIQATICFLVCVNLVSLEPSWKTTAKQTLKEEYTAERMNGIKT